MNKFDYIITKIGMDKIVHSCVCLIIALFVGLFSGAFFENGSWECAFIGGMTAFLAGLVKELADFFWNKPFDLKDLLADFVGAVIGFVFVGLLLLSL